MSLQASSVEQNKTEGQLPRWNLVPPAPDRRAIVKQLTVHWGVKGAGGFSVLNAVRDPDTTDLGRFSRRPTTTISDVNSTVIWDVAPYSMDISEESTDSIIRTENKPSKHIFYTSS
jgi:hypothetical protein